MTITNLTVTEELGGVYVRYWLIDELGVAKVYKRLPPEFKPGTTIEEVESYLNQNLK